MNTTSGSGRDYYDELYRTQLNSEAQWLAYGARDKADSVEQLVKPVLPRTERVLELGAGTGAIISELRRRGFAQSYTAVDYSEDACAHMRKTLEGVTVQQSDVVASSEKHSADVVVISHVVEHLEEPDVFLAGVVRNVSCKWLVIECPLEDLLFARLKNRFRDRTKNLAGHVQFYTPASLRQFVERHLEIVAVRHYIGWSPTSALKLLAAKNGWSKPQFLMKHITMNLLPRLTAPIWKRVWVGNYAMLCRIR